MLLFDLGGSVSLAVDWLCMVITDMVLLDLSGSVLGGILALHGQICRLFSSNMSMKT